MVRTDTRGVARAWSEGTSAKSGGSYKTDGKDLFSYNLLIGTTVYNEEAGECKKILYDYTSSGEFVSKTTSTHVGCAHPFADEFLHPSTK